MKVRLLLPLLLILLLCLLSLSIAAQPKGKKSDGKSNAEGANAGGEKKVTLTRSDGTVEQVSPQEMRKIMEKENAKRKKITPLEDGKAQETSTGSGKFDDVVKENPLMGSYINRGKHTFELLLMHDLIPENSTLSGLMSTENPLPDDFPSGSEIFIIKYKTPDDQVVAVEVQARFLKSSVSLVR